MGKIKGALANLALVFFGCVLAGVLLEVAVRILPPSFMHFRRFPIYTPDADIGFRYKPNQKAVTEAGCYRIDPVSINSSGFRDIEWPVSASGGIAILGDSMMEAEQVSDMETTSALLRKRLGVPVINAGVMGFGTFGEAATYEKYVKPLHPSVVVLFFYTGNDVTDNSCVFNRAGDGTVLKACANPSPEGPKVEKGFFVQGGALREFARTSCMSCRYAMQIYQDTKSRLKNNNAASLATRPFADVQFDVYRDEQPQDIKDAWGLTEQALVGLKQAVERDGSSFVLITVPEFSRITTKLQEELAMQARHEVPSDIDPWKPLHQVEEIAARNNILLLKLEDSFLPYRDANKITYPYFSLSCDGHWNPVGHYLASHELAGYVLDQGLLPMDASSSAMFRASINEDLAKTPKDILGDKAYEAVYNGGQYDGSSNAAAMTRTP